MSPNTETPDSAMKTTPAEMLKGISRSHGASTPPTAAKGTPLNTRTAWITRRYVKNSSVKISLGVSQLAEGKEIGDTIARADARLYAAELGGRNRVAA